MVVRDQADIEVEDAQHYHQLFLDPGNASIIDQMDLLQKFPSFFFEEEGSMANKEVTLGEIEAVLKNFPTSKSTGPYGWAVEIFLEFFYIMGSDILML